MIRVVTALVRWEIAALRAAWWEWRYRRALARVLALGEGRVVHCPYDAEPVRAFGVRGDKLVGSMSLHGYGSWWKRHVGLDAAFYRAFDARGPAAAAAASAGRALTAMVQP